MQAQIMYHKSGPMSSHQELTMAHSSLSTLTKSENLNSRETIHSGHFMVSHFEAEAQDDEDELAVPVPDEEVANKLALIAPPGFSLEKFVSNSYNLDNKNSQLSIETSLNKLFQCMSLAYRQKLTSPKWNRFKGIRLRWKDKIRLNNVIWRCWHMQFILKQSTLVCQFASPLDVDTHNKPEAVVLEGKYWKRKLAAVTAEYKKWRMFHRNRVLGWTNKDGSDMLESMDMLEWGSEMDNSGMSNFCAGAPFGAISGISGGDSVHNMMVDEDYMELMTDTLFSTISSNQPIYFPDPREIARGASLADFIQPSLGPLQPNLDDFVDTLEPLHDLLTARLPPVPEEEDVFRGNTMSNNYPVLDMMQSITQVNTLTADPSVAANNSNFQQQQSMSNQDHAISLQNLEYSAAESSQDLYRSNSISEAYTTVPPYQDEMQTNNIRREKIQSNRHLLKLPRLNQQASYQQSAPRSQQPISYQQETQQSQQQIRGYSLDLPTAQMSQPSLQLSLNPNEIQSQSQMALMSSNAGFLDAKSLKPDPDALKLTNQPAFKFSTLPSTQQFSIPQCKFTAVNTIPAQSVVAVTVQQPVISNTLLQSKQCSIDLTAPAIHPTKLLPRIQPAPEKDEIFAVPKYQMKARSRSRSSSSLSTSRVHPPPLISAVSDPALNVNSNALLAQLLTNNSSNLYTVSSGPDKILANTSQTSGVKHILPLLPSTQTKSSGFHISNPISVQTLLANPQQNQGQQQAISSDQQQILLGSNQSQSDPNSPKDNSNVHSPQALSLSPMHSPMSLGSPLSPSRLYMKGEGERGGYKEQRRVGHIHAEQKRRYNIKNGFDMLHSLIPQLNQNPTSKMSKAAMLQKGADYIRLLQSERNQLAEEMHSLRIQIDSLNASINNCQAMLPATGAPVSRQRTNKMREMYDAYVRNRTQDNWKFWIFSVLLEPLMVSFNSAVSTSSIEDLYRTTLLWVEQHCSLVDLRPAVLNSLRHICTTTEILNDPSRLPEEALAAVEKTGQQRRPNQ